MCFWRRKRYKYTITFRKRLRLNEDKSDFDQIKDDVLLFHLRRVEEKYPLDVESIRFIGHPGVCQIVFSTRTEYAHDIFADFVERVKEKIHDIHFGRC